MATALPATALESRVAPAAPVETTAPGATPEPAQPDIRLDEIPVDVRPPVPAQAGRIPQGATDDTVVADDPAPGGRVSTDVVPSTDYDTVGVTWAVGVGSDGVQVRTRTAGTWSDWTDLEDDGVAPDPGTTEAGRELRGGTESVWIGDADAIQMSFPVAAASQAQDVRLALLGPDADATSADATADVVDRDAATASRSTQRTDAAAAVPAAGPVVTAVGAPGVISRAEWGAAPARCTLDVASTLLAAVVHHTAGPNTYASVAEAMAQIRGDQAYHQDARGWCDIGYNFLVDKWGNVYEGRGESGSKPIIGVHAGGFNTATVGISMLGDYSSGAPSAAVRESVARVIAWRLSTYHRDPTSTVGYTTLGGENSRFAAGTWLALPVVIGHRDVAFTACPGEAAYGLLGAIKTRARDLIGAQFINPSVSSTSVAAGAGVTISGGVYGTIDWTLSVSDERTGIVLSRTTGAIGFSSGGPLVGWNGRTTAGAAVGAGPYRLVLSGTERLSGAPVVPYTQLITVTAGQNPPTVDPVPVVGELRFVPITPTRILDSRITGVSLGAGTRVDLQATGVAGVPGSAKAVALNVTTVSSSGVTFLRVWPAGQPMPSASVLNTDNLRTTGAGVVAGVGGQGKVSIFNNAGSTHVVVDITGYFVDDASAAGYTPLPSGARVHDTRAGAGRLTAGATQTVQVAGRSGIPSTATAVLVNVSSVLPAGPGNVIAYPAGGSVPTVASVNHLPGNNVSNRTIVPLGAGGAVSLALQGSAADVVLDVVGWFGPGGDYDYTPIVPARAWDTRVSGGGGPLGAGQARNFPLAAASLPSEAKVAVLAMAATGQTAGMTFLTAWPPSLSRPTASDLNTGKGRDQSSLTAVPLDPDRTVRIYNDAGQVDVVIDVQGWFG
ncbi:peptidoglycan recognition protein [Cellulomonas sp.]|uniref:peptidoglycan recognition protein family protein n=1 Tax=Cellulomonas sp. TaxID=40001 RepID=UPI003BAA9A63